MHFVGTATNLRLLDEHFPGRVLARQPTNPTILGTLACCGPPIGAGLLVTAVLVGIANPHARTAARVLAALSLALCVTSLGASWVGVLVNLTILAAVSYPSRPHRVWQRP